MSDQIVTCKEGDYVIDLLGDWRETSRDEMAETIGDFIAGKSIAELAAGSDIPAEQVTEILRARLAALTAGIAQIKGALALFVRLSSDAPKPEGLLDGTQETAYRVGYIEGEYVGATNVTLRINSLIAEIQKRLEA